MKITYTGNESRLWMRAGEMGRANRKQINRTGEYDKR